jgi:hypothetical protein
MAVHVISCKGMSFLCPALYLPYKTANKNQAIKFNTMKVQCPVYSASCLKNHRKPEESQCKKNSRKPEESQCKKTPGSRKNPNAKKSSRRTLPAGGSNLFIFIDYSMG